MRDIFLLVSMGIAVIWDIRTGKVPNKLILVGLCIGLGYQMITQGAAGVFGFLGGSLLPVVLLGGLYYFRMLGAGDIKLFSVVGGFWGAGPVFLCIIVSVLIGFVVSIILIIKRRNFYQRIHYFFSYIFQYLKTKQWSSYRENVDKSGSFCFSVPIFLSILLHIGGFY